MPITTVAGSDPLSLVGSFVQSLEPGIVINQTPDPSEVIGFSKNDGLNLALFIVICFAAALLYKIIFSSGKKFTEEMRASLEDNGRPTLASDLAPMLPVRFRYDSDASEFGALFLRIQLAAQKVLALPAYASNEASWGKFRQWAQKAFRLNMTKFTTTPLLKCGPVWRTCSNQWRACDVEGFMAAIIAVAESEQSHILEDSQLALSIYMNTVGQFKMNSKTAGYVAKDDLIEFAQAFFPHLKGFEPGSEGVNDLLTMTGNRSWCLSFVLHQMDSSPVFGSISEYFHLGVDRFDKGRSYEAFIHAVLMHLESREPVIAEVVRMAALDASVLDPKKLNLLLGLLKRDDQKGRPFELHLGFVNPETYSVAMVQQQLARYDLVNSDGSIRDKVSVAQRQRLADNPAWGLYYQAKISQSQRAQSSLSGSIVTNFSIDVTPAKTGGQLDAELDDSLSPTAASALLTV
jgi:hypothetical protein